MGSTFREPSFVKTLFKVVFFQRPDKIVSNTASQAILSQAKCNPKLTSKTIPEDICFNRMMEGGTFPPLTQGDFMEYLTSVSDNEYLNFLICFEHYQKLYEATPDKHKLCMPFTPQDEHKARHIITTAIQLSRAVFGNVPINLEHLHVKPFHHFIPVPKSTNHNPDLFSDCTEQHLRSEAGWLAQTFIHHPSPQEFNLDCLTRHILIYALDRTYHPSAFNLAVLYANEVLLKHYTNFIKSSVPITVNRTRILMGYLIGVSLMTAGWGFGVLMLLSKYHRAWRVLSFPLNGLGMAVLWATFHRLSIILVPMGHYQLRPWDVESHDKSRLNCILPDRETGGRWAERYHRRFLVSKWFDIEGAIQDPKLRYGEVVRMGQALWVGVLWGGVWVLVMVWIKPLRLW